MFRKIVIGILSSIILLNIIFILFINIYKTALISLLKEQINSSSDINIKYRNINLKSFGFIYALSFQVYEPEITFKDKPGNKLIAATEIDVKINPWAALNKKVHFSSIKIINGYLNIDSLLITYLTSPSTTENNTTYDFNKILLKKVLVNYSPSSKTNILLYLNSSNISGNFTTKYGKFNVYANLDSVHYNKLTFGLLNRKMVLKTDIVTSRNEINIDNGNFMYNNINYNAGLHYRFFNESLFISLSKNDISLKSQSKLIYSLVGFGFNAGNLNIHFNYRTNLSRINSDEISLKFDLKKAGLVRKGLDGLVINSLNGKYYFSSAKQKNLIDINSFHLDWTNSFVDGSVKIANLNNPKILINCLFKLDQEIFSNQSSIFSGNFNGKLKAILEINKQFSLSSLSILRMSSTFSFENILYKDNKLLKDLLGNVVIDDNNCKISFSGLFDDSKISGSVFIPTIISNINNKMLPFLSIQFTAEKIDYSRIQKTFTLNAQSSNSKTFATNYKINGLINNFTYKNYTLSKLQFELNTSNNYIEIPSFKFDIFNGSVAGMAIFRDNHSLQLSSLFKNIDINKASLFLTKELNQINFSQYISGRFNGDVKLSCNVNSIIKNNYNDLDVSCFYSISDGKLFNINQFKKISTLTKLKELETIDFKTLNNTLIIRNNEIALPEIEIQSDFVNLKISGNHVFNGEYNYYLNFKLSDLLGNKYKKTTPDIDYFMDESNKVNLFFKVTGVGSDYKISYDSKNAFINFKNNVLIDTKLIKRAILEDFTRKRNLVDSSKFIEKNIYDSTNNKKKTPPFRIEWEEIDTVEIK